MGTGEKGLLHKKMSDFSDKHAGEKDPLYSKTVTAELSALSQVTVGA